MTFRYLNRARGSGAARAFDADALAWESAVLANGGTVSLNQRILIDKLIYDLKSAGTWALMDDAWVLVAENPAQALTSLKQKRLAVPMNSPVFTADQGYAFDGVSNYIDTNFVPSVHCTQATFASVRSGVYERTNVNSSTYAYGTQNTASRRIGMRPRSSSNMLGEGNALSGTFTLTVADSRGLAVVGRSGPAATDNYGYKNGVSLTRTVDPTSVNSSGLPPDAIYIGATNSGTTPGPITFRASTLGYVFLGAPVSTGQELAEYNAIQAYMTAKGANV